MKTLRMSMTDPVVRAGLLTLALTLALLMAGIGGRDLASDPSIKRLYALGSGLFLTYGFALQYRLLFYRLLGNDIARAGNLANHRLVGVLLLGGLFLHAGGAGFALSSVLSAIMWVVALTGLFHLPLFASRLGGLQTLWLTLHVAVGTALVPLVLLHGYAALAYKG